jgi:hypothetical protein
LLPTLSEAVRKKAKKQMMAQRAVSDMEAWIKNTEGTQAFVPLDIDRNAPAAVAH